MTSSSSMVPSTSMPNLPTRTSNEPVLSHTVRSVCDLINDHIAEPLAVADLAEAVGAIVHSLQHGFRRDLNTSPTRYLRERRMAKTHELLCAGPAKLEWLDHRWLLTCSARSTRISGE